MAKNSFVVEVTFNHFKHDTYLGLLSKHNILQTV